MQRGASGVVTHWALSSLLRLSCRLSASAAVAAVAASLSSSPLLPRRMDAPTTHTVCTDNNSSDDGRNALCSALHDSRARALRRLLLLPLPPRHRMSLSSSSVAMTMARRGYVYKVPEGYPPPPPPPFASSSAAATASRGSGASVGSPTGYHYAQTAPPPPPSYYGYYDGGSAAYAQPPGNNANSMAGSPYYYNYGGAAALPPSSSSPFPPNLGTNERPIVVVPAPQKTSWAYRFWMGLLFCIAISYMISLLHELQMLFQQRDDAGGGDVSSGSGGSGMSVSRSVYGGGGGGGGGGVASAFGHAEVKPVDLRNLEVTFESIRGCDEAKQELEVIVEFLKDPQKFRELGGRLPKGALLVGPPGCGKTLLAKAIAKEANVAFFYATGSEFDELFVGVGSRRVRELFAAAKAAAPALIFIDEIDALGGKRMKSDHAYSRMTLNQLLSEMDGFQSHDEVVVLAATNTPEALDKALTRPGRLDTTIAIDPPDMKGRAEVLQIYLDKIKTDASVNAMDIAHGTTGFTGAELSNLVNLAAIRAATLNKRAVTCDDIEYAKDRVVMGSESKKIIPEADRRITAFHEGAHALTAMLLHDQGAEPVHKATIVPRGSGIMGLVQQLPKQDVYSESKRQLLARLKVCVAGRVGEEMLLGSDDITTGASSDFHKATHIARTMVRRFGFSDSIGLVDYESSDTPEGAYMSEETKRRIEREVEQLLQQAYADTKALMQQHRARLEVIAENLLKYETLTHDDLAKLMRGETLPPKPPRLSPSSSSSSSSDGGKGSSSSGGSGSGSGSDGGGGTTRGKGNAAGAAKLKGGRTVPIN